MRVLVDTHVVIWWLTDDDTLSDEIRDLLDHEPDVFLSAATVWEVAIKQELGKLVEPSDLAERVCRAGFRELPMTSRHAVAAARLPMIHRDPFDRMLVAQARLEDLTLVTRDPVIQKYEVAVFVA